MKAFTHAPWWYWSGDGSSRVAISCDMGDDLSTRPAPDAVMAYVVGNKVAKGMD